jgi:hypothetical protein
VQYPEPPIFDFGILPPKIFGLDVGNNSFIEHLEFRLNNNLNPLFMLPIDYMDYYSSSLSILP